MKTLDTNFRSLIPQVSIKLTYFKRRISTFLGNQGESENCVPQMRLPVKNC